MPTLLHINSSLNYGSTGRICENIGLIAKNDGWDVYQAHGVKYARRSQLKTYPVCSRLAEWKHTFFSLLFDAHGLASVSETKRLTDWIKEISPDVIHLHNLHGYYLNYKHLFEFLSEYDVPIVWTLHDLWPITGHCAHFDYVNCNKWRSECENCQQLSGYPRSLCIDNSNRNFKIKKKAFTSVKNLSIVAVSNWLSSLVKCSFLGQYPISTIYNGVNTELFKPTLSDLRSRLNLNSKFILLGVASPWYKLKGYDDYIALSRVIPKDCVIIMIGVTDAQKKLLPHNIIGIERTDNQLELAEYYSMADVTLNLSYQESFGLTTIEGLACGTPAIVYNRTASPELITSETGMMVDAGDIDSLLKAVLCIKGKGKTCFSEACRRRALDNFDEHLQLRKYIQLYDELIKL